MSPSTSGSTSTDQNKALIRRYLDEVWSQGQINKLRDLVTKDIIDHDPAPGQPCGLEGQEWFARAFLGGLSNTRLTVEHVLAQADRVVDRWTFSGIHTGDLFGMAPTGRKFTTTGTDEYRIAGGRIAEVWHREDILSMMQQLGFAPAPALPQSFGRPSSSMARPGGGGMDKPLPERDVKDLIRRAFQQMLDQGDLSKIDSFIAPDYVGHFSALPPVYGRDGFREFISMYTNGLSNRHTDIEEILVDGEWAAVRVTYHNTDTGGMMGMPATGKQLAVKALMTMRMAGDKLAEQWANNDDMGMMQQLGAIPEMAGAERQPC